jgi:hypothetical protein
MTCTNVNFLCRTTCSQTKLVSLCFDSRATAFIGKAIDAFPIIGAIGIPATYFATHPELAPTQTSLQIALSGFLSP